MTGMVQGLHEAAAAPWMLAYMLAHRKSGADFFWSHRETEMTQGPQNLTTADMDIWIYQETSMNRAMMQYNKRNVENLGAKWIYNDIRACDVVIMISRNVAARLHMVDIRCIKHALLVSCIVGAEKSILIYVRTP